MSRIVPEPSFTLLVQCCQRNFAGWSGGPVEIPDGVDWPRFVALARFHRVHGLAWNALKEASVPQAVRQDLAADARSIAATNLAVARECSGLNDDFTAAHIPLLFVKGLTVAALAYRNPMLKMAWDIDLLIEPGDLGAAARLLTDRGYALHLPSTPTSLQSWHSRSKESIWHRDNDLHVELHSRLADNRQLIPTIGVHSPRQRVQLTPAVSLQTLAEELLFAYLAVHGASSAWFRLKWISDFAAMIHRKGSGDLERLYRRSQGLGAARAAGQALLLADRLFDVLRPVPGLKAQLLAGRSTRMLYDAALRTMTAGTEPTERPLGTLTIHWTQFLLRPELGFKLSELGRQTAALFSRSAR